MGKKVFMKYYAIKKGLRDNVIVDNWEQCKLMTEGLGFKTKYKSFFTLEEAEAYLNDDMELIEEYIKRRENGEKLKVEVAQKPIADPEVMKRLQSEKDNLPNLKVSSKLIYDLGGYDKVKIIKCHLSEYEFKKFLNESNRLKIQPVELVRNLVIEYINQ